MSDYTYDATIVAVIDGDTVDADLDLGFDIHTKMRLRLYGINAPEVHSKDLVEKEAGLKAKDYLTKLVGGKAVVVETIKDAQEKYGRYLAKITLVLPNAGTSPVNPVNVNENMVNVGYAKPYFGGKR